MEILYCEKCGKRVSDKALSEGGAVRVEEKVYCTACKDVPEKTEALAPTVTTPSGAQLRTPPSELHRTVDAKPPHAARMSGTFRASKRSTAENKTKPAPAKNPALLAAFVAVPIVVVLLFVILGRGDKTLETRAAKTKTGSDQAPKPDPARPEPAKTEATATTTPRPVPAHNPAAQAALNPPSQPAEKSPEERAGDALEAVLRFEGLAAGDKDGKIKALEAYLEKHGDTIVAARARRALSELKEPPKVAEAPKPPPAEAGPAPDANDAGEPSSEGYQVAAGPYRFENDAEGWQGDGTPLSQGNFLGRACIKMTPGGQHNVCRGWRGNRMDVGGLRVKFRYYAHNLHNVEVLFALDGNRPRKGVTGFTNDKWMWATISAQEFNLSEGTIAHVEIGGGPKGEDAFLLVDDVTWEKK
ncbi:MAG: hypothetical protein KIS92_15725 [Planctomycetota bacterium]|nr:hypothetical protein [Planctomycetota bacterium]